MTKSEQNIHIELDVTLNTENDNPSLRNISVKLKDKKSTIDGKLASKEKTKVKIESDSKQRSTTNSEHKADQKDDTNQFVMVGDIIGLPDELLDEKNNNNNLKDSFGSNTTQTPSVSKSSKDNLGGGGDKPISSRQRNLINKMADEQNKNVEEVVNSICHKSIDDLKGHEADKVIKSMRKPRR